MRRTKPALDSTWIVGAVTIAVMLAIVLLDHFIVHPPTKGLGEFYLRHGLGDEVGHLLTAVVCVLAAWALGIGVVLWPALLGSTLIDFDHLLLKAGLIPLAHGTGRPVTHSIVPLLVLLACAIHFRHSRRLWLSAAFGFSTHLWRDASTSPVMMGWPVWRGLVSYPYWVYVIVTAALPLLAVAFRQLYRSTRAPQPPPVERGNDAQPAYPRPASAAGLPSRRRKLGGNRERQAPAD